MPNAIAVDRADLLYRVGTDETLNLAAAPADGLFTSDASVAVNLFVDMQAAYVPMGVTLTFYWELSSGDQVVATTAEESALWMDTRFEWTAITSDQVKLHSYNLSSDFAQRVLDSAQSTMTDLEQRYDLERLHPIAVWVYESSADFSGTRQINTRETVAGMSYPGASVIAAVIPDGSDRELGRVLPHEISHQALFQATLNPFNAPPLWFDEGLATHYQIGGTEHYRDMVIQAEANDALFNISSLSVSFPFQPAQATLAYASSWSMLEYIGEAHGDEGIARQIDAFGQGTPPDEAVAEALGISLEDLNASWHAWVAAQGLRLSIAA